MIMAFNKMRVMRAEISNPFKEIEISLRGLILILSFLRTSDNKIRQVVRDIVNEARIKSQMVIHSSDATRIRRGLRPYADISNQEL